MALFGYVLQRVVFNRTLGDDLLPPLLVEFGLSVIIQNSLLMTFSADSRKLDAELIETASWNVAPGLSLGLLPLLMFGAAIVVIGSLRFMFYRTPLGRALRATSDDPEVARLIGYDNKHLLKSRWRCLSRSSPSRGRSSPCARISRRLTALRG